MKDTIVLYPSPGIGHLVGIVELGRLINQHHPSFTIIILITTAPFNTGSTTPYINHISKTNPSLVFHHLPSVTVNELESFPSLHHEALNFELIRLNNPLLHTALQTISQTSNVRSVVLDFFCGIALEVTFLLNIPSYIFFSSAAGALVSFLYTPTIHRNTSKSLKDLNTYLDFPGIPSILSSDMPLPMLDRNDPAYSGFLSLSLFTAKGNGIIVNTFECLEEKAIKAITEGFCVLNGTTPPIYCIGPLIMGRIGGESGNGDEMRPCLTWLDKQPSRSVVFLCFGSYGSFSAAQLREIALGLERSGQRFLWVVRIVPTENTLNASLSANGNPDLESLLPKNFLDRTKEQGLVVNTWVPQVDVLNHISVGGFVTHAGWNSVLESVCAGVPMVVWPLYAEQRINRVLLVDDMKLAMSMNESENGFVDTEEVERKVRSLMNSDEGKGLRERTLAARDQAVAALSEGGSSRAALAKLAESWKSG
ncbi:hypothetical protein GIB67_027819 [Kingdonia uniflora]|uniref:Glycosyltransferase n=1 Tax=Kingdonia uniflora TaxID=39325 RepID=A0A7J7MI25_9MAGN|nr:hypothetical protein GIB67_027819 [Kingdonia uniflora]